MGATVHTVFNGVRIEIEYPRATIVEDPKKPGFFKSGDNSGLWKWTAFHPNPAKGNRTGFSVSRASALLSAQAAASDA